MGARGVRLGIAVVIGILALAPAIAAGPPVTLDDVVLFARSRIRFSQYDRHAVGQLVVNDPGGVAILRRSFSTLIGTQMVADSIEVRGARRRKGPVLYDVFANKTDPRVIVAGSGPNPISLPLFPFPSPQVATPGTDTCPSPGTRPGDCIARVPGPQPCGLTPPLLPCRGGPLTILPGHYNRVAVKGAAALYFAGGEYHMHSLRAGSHARVYFNGPTTLFIEDQFRLGPRVLFGPPVESQLNPRCIVVNVGGTRTVRFSLSANVTATISAPAASMRLGEFGDFRGNFIANDIVVGLDVLLETPPHLTSPCQ